ncbi:MAG: hypothetical protein JXR76_23590 [Deltaproteobacteria bacterium]|nr:hypothetical protein [Deltaproteobacteria bacterium]
MKFHHFGSVTVFVTLICTGTATLSANAPLGWLCPDKDFGNSKCDCGCGALDEDCYSLSATVCENDWCEDDEFPGYLDNSQCIPFGQDDALPDGWICGSYWYGDGDYCDCGCGALDADCTNSSVNSCQDELCYDKEDPDAIVSYPGYNDNWNCYLPGADPALEGWVCAPGLMSDGYCDCGCGSFDSDCGSEQSDICYDAHCDASHVVDPENNAICVLPGIGDSDTVVADTDSGNVDTGSDLTETDSQSPVDTDTAEPDSALDSATSNMDTDSQRDTIDAGDTGTAVATGPTINISGDTANTVNDSIIVPRNVEQTAQNATSSNDAESNGSENLFACTMGAKTQSQSLLQLLF